MAKKVSAAESARRLARGVDQLARGMSAEAWVCREVLDLGMGAELDEVVSALHRALHQWERANDVGVDRMVRARIRAAGVLVSIME